MEDLEKAVFFVRFNDGWKRVFILEFIFKSRRVQFFGIRGKFGFLYEAGEKQPGSKEELS